MMTIRSRAAASFVVGILVCLSSVSCAAGSHESKTGTNPRASVDPVWVRYESVGDVAASSTIAIEVVLESSPTYVPFEDESGKKPWGYSRYSARVSKVLGSTEEEVLLAEGDLIFVETDGASERLQKDDPEFAAELAKRSNFELAKDPFVVLATLKTDYWGGILKEGDIPILYVTGNRFGILSPSQGAAPSSEFVWLAPGVETSLRYSSEDLQTVSDARLGTRAPMRPGIATAPSAPTVPDVPPEGRPPASIDPSSGRG